MKKSWFNSDNEIKYRETIFFNIKYFVLFVIKQNLTDSWICIIFEDDMHWLFKIYRLNTGFFSHYSSSFSTHMIKWTIKLTHFSKFATFFHEANLIADNIKVEYSVKNSSNGNRSKKKGETSLKQQATCWFQFQQYTLVKETRHQTDRLININNWCSPKNVFIFILRFIFLRTL